MHRKLLPIACLLALLFASLELLAQNTIALPQIVNYPKQAYNAGMQNWKIAQGPGGIIYVANDEGLLSFDGQYWKKYVIPTADNIRSIAFGRDGRLYAGSQGEIGYFEPGSNGVLTYHSLNHLIPETEKDFTDIWDVIPYGNEVFFRSYKRLFELKNDRITVYPNPAWSFLGINNGRLISKAWQKGILTFDNGNWVPFLKDTLPEKAQIISILPLNRDSSLLITKKHGSYILRGDQLLPNTSADMAFICSKNPYSAVEINKDQIAIATSISGCYIINKRSELVQRLSREDGLQNNNILSVFADRDQNLWLGLSNGIDFIAYNNAIRTINADYREHSSGKAAIMYNGMLYIGTNNGLYRASTGGQKNLPFIKAAFEPVPNIKGQVWNLAQMNGQLIMGHNDGFYQIIDGTPHLIDSSSGFWTFLPLSNVMPAPVILAGTYNGVNFYGFTNNRFYNLNVHSHFESARFVAIDDKIAWAVHPLKGLYRIDLNGGVKPTNAAYVDNNHILSEKNQNHLFKVKSRIVLTNEKGFFEYNWKTGDFEPSRFFKNIFGKSTVDYMKEDGDGNIWFIASKKLGVVDFSGKASQLTYFPELNNRIVGNGLEYIYPYDARNILIAGEEGFFHLNYEQFKSIKGTTPVAIATVKINNNRDSVIYGGYNLAGAPVAEIDHAWNSMHFEFASSLYGKQASVEYAWQLEGFEKTWSVWSKKTNKEYTDLSPGTYVFKVKARTQEGKESAVATYRFTVLAPWYRTGLAYFVYILFVLALLYAIYRWQKRKFILQQQKHEEERNKLEFVNRLQKEKYEEEQKQLLYLHQLEIERNEKEIIRLQNEKLEAEIQLKNTELASTSMNLIQQGEMLVKVKEEFVRMKKVHEMDKDSEDYKKILRMLGENNMKKNWEQFAVHFDKVHSDFLVSLKDRYPNMTPSELKLCAYLRLNLSSKEIAQIMNITIKSVELGRHRLRKKLGIEPNVNLFNFLLNFHSEDKSLRQ